LWRGPAGPRFPWTFALAPRPSGGRCRDRRPRSSQSAGRGTGSAVAGIAPGGGVGALSFPVPPWPPLSPLALSSSRLVWISAGCGSGCSIAQPPPQPAAAWWLAARRCRGRGSCRPPMARGRCGGCERPAKAHQAAQVWGRGAVGRGCADRAAGPPITGAGLDPSCTPAGIPSSGSDGEGCWGGRSSRDGRQRWC
jgi:hypothetical protein